MQLMSDMREWRVRRVRSTLRTWENLQNQKMLLRVSRRKFPAYRAYPRRSIYAKATCVRDLWPASSLQYLGAVGLRSWSALTWPWWVSPTRQIDFGFAATKIQPRRGPVTTHQSQQYVSEILGHIFLVMGLDNQ